MKTIPKQEYTAEFKEQAVKYALAVAKSHLGYGLTVRSGISLNGIT